VGALAATLQQRNSTLSFLDLEGNDALRSGACALAAALLDGNFVLTRLDLGNNAIGSQGVQPFREVLERNTTLTWLKLQSGDIQAPGAIALAAGILIQRDNSCNFVL
jgi:hypothetical protein